MRAAWSCEGLLCVRRRPSPPPSPAHHRPTSPCCCCCCCSSTTTTRTLPAMPRRPPALGHVLRRTVTSPRRPRVEPPAPASAKAALQLSGRDSQQPLSGAMGSPWRILIHRAPARAPRLVLRACRQHPCPALGFPDMHAYHFMRMLADNRPAKQPAYTLYAASRVLRGLPST